MDYQSNTPLGTLKEELISNKFLTKEQVTAIEGKQIPEILMKDINAKFAKIKKGPEFFNTGHLVELELFEIKYNLTLSSLKLTKVEETKASDYINEKIQETAKTFQNSLTSTSSPEYKDYINGVANLRQKS